MRDFSDFVLAVERRARLIRSGEGGMLFLVVLSLIYFAFSLSLRLLVSPIPTVPVAVGALIPILAGGTACLIIYRRPLDPARLLLRLDIALGLEARMSSLQELRGGGSPAIRRRIEARIAPHLERWKRGLPIPPRAIVGFILGSSFLLAGLALPLFPFGSVPSLENPAHAEVSASSQPPGSAAPQAEGREGAASLAGASVEGAVPLPETGYSLADIIAELQISPSLVGGSTGGVGSETRLQELLAQIEARLRSEGGLLTEAERFQLEGAIPTAGRSAAEGLAGLLAAESPAELAGRLEKLVRTVKSAPSTTGETGGLNAAGREGGGEGRSVGMPEEGATTTVPSSSSASPEGEGRFPGSEGGGEGPAEGAPSPLDEERAGPGLLIARVPGTIGEEGRIDLLLTAGVPIEDRQSEGESGSPAISFAKIDSILSRRSLPPAARETVRKYFEAITQGGP